MQAVLPEPSGWAARRLTRKKNKSSEGAEIVDSVVELALTGWLWGVLIAVPGVIIWIVRRLRHKAG